MKNGRKHEKSPIACEVPGALTLLQIEREV